MKQADLAMQAAVFHAHHAALVRPSGLVEQAASRETLQHIAAALLQRPADDPAVLAELPAGASGSDHEARAAPDEHGLRVADGPGTL